MNDNAYPKAARKLRVVFTATLTLFIIFFGLQKSLRIELINAVSTLMGMPLLILLILLMLLRLLQAAGLKSSLKIHNYTISSRESVSLVALKGVFNLGFGGLGLAAQSAKAKASLNIPVKRMIYANLTQSCILVFSLGMVLIFCSLTLSITSLPAQLIALSTGCFLAILGVISTYIVLYPDYLIKKAGNFPYFYLIGPPAHTSPANPSCIAKLGLIQLMLIALRVIKILLIACIIDQETDLVLLTTAVVAADSISVIPITPGGIGIRELAIGLVGAATEHYETFLAAAIIDRVLIILFNLVHGFIVVVFQSRQNKLNE